VVVLGHPQFYPRFGFRPSVEFDVDSDYDVPAEVFMMQELICGCLSEKSGRVKYHAAFSAL
jgi:putative acetyltransferase